jgi:hypothetical protein
VLILLKELWKWLKLFRSLLIFLTASLLFPPFSISFACLEFFIALFSLLNIAFKSLNLLLFFLKTELLILFFSLLLLCLQISD